ncbi:MAG: DMT family transporter [Chloroflexota bacterium]
MARPEGKGKGPFLEPFAVITAVLWGSVFPAAQVALRTLTPFGLAWWRASIAFVFLALVAFVGFGPAIDLRRLRAPEYVRLAVLSWLQIMGFAVLFNFAVLNSGPVISAFVVNTYPALAVLGAPFLLGERAAPRRSFGAVLSVAGAFLLLGATTAVSTAGINALAGGAFGFAASLCTASYLLLSRRWTHRYKLDARTIALFGPVFSAPPLLALALATSGVGALLAFRADSLAATLWMGIFGSGVAYLAINHSLRRGSATQSALALLLIPIVATLLSLPLFHTALAPIQLAGAAVCLGGMVLAALD